MEKFDFFKLLNVYDYDEKLMIKGIISFVVSLIVASLSLPKILIISYKKKLFDIPKERSIHKKSIPNLGGVAIFFGFMASATTFSSEVFSSYIFLTSSLLLFLFTGVLDDILIVSARQKFYAQLVAAILITIGSNIRVSSFFGIFGIYSLPYWVSIAFTVLLIVFIINSFNFIDGIDGLAGFVSIVVFSAFAIAFFKIHPTYYVFSIISVSMLGAILPFIYYNLSEKKKIFMGDTGSMIIGFIVSFLSVIFLNFFSNSTNISYSLKNAPIVVIAMLIIPIIDTLSVILVRILKRKNPFMADKNHIHHHYIDAGFSHKETSIYLSLCNILVILFAFFFSDLEINFLLICILVFSLLTIFTPILLIKYFK